MRWAIVLLLVVLAGRSAALYAAEVNLSTPKEAAKSLFNAVNGGDRAGIREVLHASDDQQQALADAMAGLIVAGKRLGDAAHAKYGAEGDGLGRGMLDPSGLERLDTATVNESGDTATLEVPGQNRPMSFRRSDGKWRLVITNFGGASPENIERQTRLVRQMSDAMDESASDISSGKFPTVADATNGIQKRLHEVMLKFSRPSTTRATTAPATTPATRETR